MHVPASLDCHIAPGEAGVHGDNPRQTNLFFKKISKLTHVAPTRGARRQLEDAILKQNNSIRFGAANFKAYLRSLRYGMDTAAVDSH